MSRRLTLLAAAVLFSGFAATAEAQMAGQRSSGSGSSNAGSMDSGAGGTPLGMSGSGSAATTGGASMSGTGGSTMRQARPARPMASDRSAMRSGSSARGTTAGRQTADANRAYMGGGAVYERSADGSLRPVN